MLSVGLLDKENIRKSYIENCSKNKSLKYYLHTTSASQACCISIISASLKVCDEDVSLN
jgi:hypothetical protein